MSSGKVEEENFKIRRGKKGVRRKLDGKSSGVYQVEREKEITEARWRSLK